MKKKQIQTSLTDALPEQGKTEEAGGNIFRPVSFDGYIGQERIKKNMKVYIQSAKKRGDSLDHILLYGPPGLGKTTLAHIIANEMGKKIKITSAPAIEKPGDIASIITGLNDGDILFIDEIHRLPKNIEEVLYSAMEDFAIDIIIGSGEQGKSVRLSLPKFTLIGATTRAGMLSPPLRDRFGITEKLSYYTKEELGEILVNSSRKLELTLDKDLAENIGARSRGTPRIANNLLKRIRDFAQVENECMVTAGIVEDALSALGVDKDGLTENDHALISCIRMQFQGGPVGLSTLASAIGEDEQTISDVYEPYLIFTGVLVKTPRGRILSESLHKEKEKSL